MEIPMGGMSAALVTLLRLEPEPNNYVKSSPTATNTNTNPITTNPSSPFLSLSKPSWIVRTESNVRKEIRKKPHPQCVVCHGTGRVDCHLCSGLAGRTNFIHLAMLPKGEWPKWCRTCGGSGLNYCSRCLGTGEYRYIMGFHFMEQRDNPHPPHSPS
ncbi:protein SSUH2 homolog isoform X1 [Ricinus communis]|uniref:protein SSUH2 homolog isoform X1 n=1 Tax=Ricinus communis TaxID=3988 RepID=UPI00201AC18B|nr:protein SSUH2 homolog isoform X1 [Ricinus communis]